ncbi:RinB-like transcriptional activator [Staphylococcus phage JD007]|uniref:Membrane protein n=1 Tax=Staphylococcus phage JD007 TaxID=1239383 RepID=K7QMR6_9CAUD|nr:RinB-like transcriptional activator [Staphylococcus phage JD007]AFV50758.1 membrane protein [Staphylococcus phage JD007]
MKNPIKLLPIAVVTILTFSLTYVILKKETNNKRTGVAPFDFSLEDHIHLNKEIK